MDATNDAAAAVTPSIPCNNPAEPSDVGKTDDPTALKPLSSREFKIYNHMAEHMNYYHNHFRETWNQLYSTSAPSSQSSPSNTNRLTVRQFLRTGEAFCAQLTMHHTIEEQHIFPVLARRMPAFARELHLLSQHKQIHAGLERFEEYLAACRTGERDLRMPEARALMDAFGDVLWTHLDDEVRQLGAENMRKFWSEEEMQAMPM